MEKIYLTMKHAGILNIVFGILLAVGSALTAVGSAFMIMYGARLLKKKSEIMFQYEDVLRQDRNGREVDGAVAIYFPSVLCKVEEKERKKHGRKFP